MILRGSAFGFFRVGGGVGTPSTGVDILLCGEWSMLLCKQHLQPSIQTLQPFCVKTKWLKWCYYHVNLYIDFLIMSRSTKDRMFLMNNIPKRKRKEKHNNLVKCLEPHYINNNIGFILGSKHSTRFVHKPTRLKIKFKPSQSSKIYSPHLLCLVSRNKNIYINAMEFKSIFAL